MSSVFNLTQALFLNVCLYFIELVTNPVEELDLNAYML